MEKWRVISTNGVKFSPCTLSITPDPEFMSCLSGWSPSDGSPVNFYKNYLSMTLPDPEDEPDWLSINDEDHSIDWVPIHWSVRMESHGREDGYWLSPFHNPDFHLPRGETWYSQWSGDPISEKTGLRVNWHSLPMSHRYPEFWKELGWEPSPFQRRLWFKDAFHSYYVGG